MSRFYAEISGQARTIASRTGSDYSGAWGHVRGWDVGAIVEMRAEGSHDLCILVATSGSGYEGLRAGLGTIERNDGALIFKPTKALRDMILRSEGVEPMNDEPSAVVLHSVDQQRAELYDKVGTE